MSCTILILCFFLKLGSSESSIQDGFLFNGYFKFGDSAELNNSNMFSQVIYADSGLSKANQVFYNHPFKFKNSPTGSAFSFSTTFIVAVVAKDPEFNGHGLAFAISPSKGIPGALPNQHLGLFNASNNGNSSNHVVAVELDTDQDFQFNDIDDNHLGIDINGLMSVQSATAGYHDEHGRFKQLYLKSGKLIQVMYVGFSSAGGSKSSHYIFGWSFRMNGQADEINLSTLPDIPGVTRDNEGDAGDGYRKVQKILAVVLSLVGVIFLLLLIFGALMISRRRKFIQVLEDWEMLYGPHRFSYKDLFIATKGFRQRQLLGKGGFGRAPELGSTSGYCRRKNELFLVYDYMPNGSLDKFLYQLPNCILNWKQRFKIIKDVASALFYLHQQWVQVIIHRDIKPANVLIDEQMNARLGDFGLARLCDHGNAPQTSHVAGTPGYIDPEIVQSGKSTTCTDIYAFGVFMLEVTCGRKPVDPQASLEKVVLIDWVMNCWDRGAILEAVDCKLGDDYVLHETELVLKLGLLCSHPVAAGRPSMSSVVQFLDGAAQLPESLSSMIKSRDFGDNSGQGGVAYDEFPSGNVTIASLTFTESFASDGR
ncbi:hypothetical protein GH714_033570 [Hevea brasiliensis]|uniref:non-specific serine/threonine protein kinase n=1 Tax=Hevea brasiliensis TaxID=3981 RepID=A0A6A6KJZ1_HEVBR|nr:hypothetical protein GH714_033570 [Hevea brasiliensis]